MKVKNDKNKIDIKSQLISNELNEFLKSLIVFLLISILFGYVGYIYSKDNNLSISHGIIFGVLFPLGVGLLEMSNFSNFFITLIYTIAYLAIASHIPTFVGGIILFIIIGLLVINFIYIEKKDRTKEIEEYNNYNNCNKKRNVTTIQNNNYIAEDYSIKENPEEYECEMCFKKISEEEYELYDCMCEECFMDAHTDKYGNFHDDEYFDS